MPYGKKTCAGGGRTCPAIISIQDDYCPEHARAYEVARGTRQQRGYDADHDALRAEHQERIDAGEIVRCWRCGTRLLGRLWHLGHDDNDRTKYKGPECVPCNTSAGARQGLARRR